MKKLIMILAAAATLACAPATNYTVNGKLNLEGDVIYLLDSKKTPIDSAAMVDGVFSFTGMAEIPSMCIISDTRDASNFRASFVLEEGTITIAADEANPMAVKVSGTVSNDAFAAHNAKAQALIEEYEMESTTDERRAAIEAEYENLAPEAIKANYDNLFGVMMLRNALYELSGEEILAEVAAFAEPLQKSEMLIKIREIGERKTNVAVGCQYIDVEQPAPDGGLISLKSTIEDPANKYVLLDFWASWCGPCMGEVPFLKAAYEAYHDKGFEIYAISLDNDAAKWNATIDRVGMPWLHVSTLNRFENAAVEPYAVMAIPTNFLIDCSTGQIVATNLHGEEVSQKLAELLAE